MKFSFMEKDPDPSKKKSFTLIFQKIPQYR